MNESFIATKKKVKYFSKLKDEEIPKNSFEMIKIPPNILSFKKSVILEQDLSVKIC